MVDLAEAGAAVLVLRPVAMILHAEAADLASTLADVGDRIEVQIVHHVPGVVVDVYAGVVHFANDLGAGFAGSGRAAVLFDDDQHSVVASDRAEGFESLDPHRAVATLRMSEGQHLADPRRRGLLDPLSQHLQPARMLRIDRGEHHHRFQSEIAAPFRQRLRGLWRGVFGHDGHLLAVGFTVLHAPCDVAITGRLDPRQRTLQRKVTVRERHAGVLKLGRLALGGLWLGGR